jgi:uncharacterized protein (TIGR02246 family)
MRLASRHAEIRRQVDGLKARFVAGLKAADAPLVGDVYAPDATLIPPGRRPVDGRAAIERYWHKATRVIDAVRLETVELDERDGLAVDVGRYAFAAGQGSGISGEGSYVLVIRRQPDGAWRWAIHSWNFEPDRGMTRQGQPERSGRATFAWCVYVDGDGRHSRPC